MDCRFWRYISTEPFMLIGAMIFSIHQMTLTQLLIANGCHRKFNSTVCNNLGKFLKQENDIQQDGAIWMAIITSTSLAVGFVALLGLGRLADKTKKTRLMLLTPIFSGAQSAIYFSISYFMTSFSPAYLLIGAVMSGIYGELQGIIMLAAAFLANITDDASRTLRFNMLAMSIYFGFILSGVPTGLLLRAFGYPSVFIFTFCLNVLNFLFVRLYLWYQELDVVDEVTTPAENETSTYMSASESSLLMSHARWYTCKQLGRLKDTVAVLFNARIRVPMILIMFVFCLALMNIVPETIIQVFYLKRYPFNFNAVEIGELVTIQNVIRAISASVLNVVLTVKLKVPDVWIVALTFASHVLYFLSMALTKSRVSVLPLQLLGIGLPLTAPSLRAMMSKLVSPAHQGIAMATAEVLDTSAALVSTIVLNLVYSQSVSLDPAVAFYIFTGIGALSFVLMIVYRFVERKALFPQEDRVFLVKHKD